MRVNSVDDGLRFEKFAEGDLAPFASISGLLIAAERSFGIFTGSVHEDHSRLEPRCHLIGSFIRCRLDVGGEPVVLSLAMATALSTSS